MSEEAQPDKQVPEDIDLLYEGDMFWSGLYRAVEIRFHKRLGFYGIYRAFHPDTIWLSFLLRREESQWEYRLGEDPGRASLMPDRWKEAYDDASPVATAIRIVEELEGNHEEPGLEETD